MFQAIKRYFWRSACIRELQRLIESPNKPAQEVDRIARQVADRLLADEMRRKGPWLEAKEAARNEVFYWY